jgi:L-rhamnose mutarotase
VQRACSILQIKKERIGDYLAAHQVWPELLQAMHDAGIRNYSLFMAEDGTVVEYFEAANPEEAMRQVGQTDVSRRWEAHVAEYFAPSDDLPSGTGRPLDQYFHMA